MEAVDLSSDTVDDMRREVLEPAEIDKLVSGVTKPTWVYRYTSASRGWVISIATQAEPGSQKLSLGGFRIAPETRTSLPGYSNDAEAIGLAEGMSNKVAWTKLIHAGGPLGQKNLSRIVGGKCVLFPSPDIQIGKPGDFDLLDFAIQALSDCNEYAGILINTGQDMGHGIMSDGKTHTLSYLHEHFPGSILADTSKPTAEGNYYALRGMLAGLEIPIRSARIGLIGVGNIGMHVCERLLGQDATVSVVELADTTRQRLKGLDIQTWHPDDKFEFLNTPLDALVINASGGTLDLPTIDAIVKNDSIKAVCGCENLVMPDPSGVEILRSAGVLFAPTEFCGMMGYLTAVEEYLSYLEGREFSIETMFDAAPKLEEAGKRGAEVAIQSDHELTFADAMRKAYEQ